MKKLFLSAAFAWILVAASAQKFSKVETAYVLNKFEDAKAEIDKIASDPKYQSNPEVWLWNATIYGSLYADPNMSIRFPEAGQVAWTSFNKYMELDPSYKIMTGSPIPGKTIIDIMYGTNLKQGIAYFDKKKWDSAFKYFQRSADVGDLISKNDWRGNKQPIDTITVLFTGYAAQNSKNETVAASYYGRLAELKITNIPPAGDIKDVYEYLVYHYLNAKNSDQFNKFLALAKELYPKEIDNWAAYELDYMENNLSLTEKAAAYDKADAAGTLTANQYLSFGNMFYNIKEDDKAKLDSATLSSFRQKAEAAFVKGFGKDKTNGLLAFNVGLLNYNDWVDLDDKYENNIKKIAELNRSKTAEKDPKKKAANDARIKKEVDAVKALNAGIEKSQHAYADKAIEWMENAFSILSVKENMERAEKNVLGKSVDYLANLYLWKRDKSKGNNADYDKYDALYKKYDVLHGKY